ncbi:MAG: hypothetical protein NVS9B5_26840 [Terriglobales bacterium]
MVEPGLVVPGVVVLPGVSVPGVVEFPGVAVPESGVAVLGSGVTVPPLAPAGFVFMSGLFDVGELFPGVEFEPGVVDCSVDDVPGVVVEPGAWVADPAVPVWLDADPVLEPVAPADPAEPAACGVISAAISTLFLSAEVGPFPVLPAALQ